MSLFLSVASVDTLPEDLPTLYQLARTLPFGDADIDRLCALRNPAALRHSLAARQALLGLLQLRGLPAAPILRSPEGKPYFDTPAPLPFSLSHAHSLAVALLGEPHGGALGVDIEFLRTDKNTDAIAARFFSEQERGELVRLGSDPHAFCRLWTKKEALAKRHGHGLLAQDSDHSVPCRSFRLLYRNREAYLTVAADFPSPVLLYDFTKELHYHELPN